MEYTGLDVLVTWMFFGFNVYMAKVCLVNFQGPFGMFLMGLNAGAAFGSLALLCKMFFG